MSPVALAGRRRAADYESASPPFVPVRRSYVPDDGLDIDAITAASDGFTPADIRHAAQQVAQQTFELAVESGRRQRATTEDYLATVAATRPTLTAAMISEFSEDTAAFART